MKKSHHMRTHLLHGAENSPRTFFLVFLLSLVCHVTFFFSLIFIPNLKSPKRFSPSVINVSMVSFPEALQAPGEEAATEEPDVSEIKAPEPKPPVKKILKKKNIPEPVLKNIPEPVVKAPLPKAEVVSIAPKKKKYKPKTSLKKKTFKPSKVAKSAIKRMEKNVDASRRDQIASAIDRLKDKVKAGYGKKRGASNKALPPSAGTGLLSGQGTGGIMTSDIGKLYNAKVGYDIQKNWAFSKQLAGNATHLKTVLVIKIMANGKIKDIWFEKRSGNKYLDESAYRAVQKSDPLTPLPTGLKRSFHTLGIVFTPSGVQ